MFSFLSVSLPSIYFSHPLSLALSHSHLVHDFLRPDYIMVNSKVNKEREKKKPSISSIHNAYFSIYIYCYLSSACLCRSFPLFLFLCMDKLFNTSHHTLGAFLTFNIHGP